LDHDSDKDICETPTNIISHLSCFFFSLLHFDWSW